MPWPNRWDPGNYRKPGRAAWSSRMVITMRPAQSSSSSHTGTLPGSEGSGVGQGPPQYPSTEEYAHGRECPQPTPRTHAVRAAGAAGSDYPLPRRTGLFRGLPGARVHGPFQAGRPRRSPRCRDTPSHSRGAAEGRGGSVRGGPAGSCSLWKSHPYAQEAPLTAGLDWPAHWAEAGQGLPRHRYLERECYVDGD